jgi:hypothetical protein
MRLTMAMYSLLLVSVGLRAETKGASSWSGLMLDAGCTDRSLDNLRAQPRASLPVSKEPQKKAEGIQVTPRLVAAQRAEAALAHTADHASRYSSSSCALTADTKAFMLLLPDGTLLNLDEGGNTLAFEAFQSTSAGQAILNGKVGGLKPQVTVSGIQTGDRLRTRSVEIHQPKAAPPAK